MVLANMASRSHVDGSVNERRLRPIYDCLDNGNNKKALQEAEKLLKKQRDFLCAKVLKALALIRLGRQEESLTTLREVHAEGPTDDSTLQAMTICYRELHKPEWLADAYETAVKKDPQNEELLSHLFMSYVRLGEYKKQQQTAMVLYKLKPKNPYYFWAVMSIVMQASSGDEALSRTMLLPLAERMTDKFVKENKIEAEAEVQLYLMILEQQEKYEEALEVLNGPLGEKLTFYLDFLPRRRAELLTKLKRWPEANSAYKQLILSNQDQWSYYVEYFNSLFELVDSCWQPNEQSSSLDPQVDYTLNMALDFVGSLVHQQDNFEGQALRGPYLAQLELMRRLKERKENHVSGTFVERLMSYYTRFGTKPSCYLDMAHLVTILSLSPDDRDELLQQMNSSLNLQSSFEIDLPKDPKEMQRNLCYCQLSHFVGHHKEWSKQQKISLAREFMERYHHGLQFGTHLLSTDFQPCDNYCLLAAVILIEMWKESGEERLVAQVLGLLEHGLKKSPSNFQIKLLLIKLYNLIGAVGVSHALYESIDVKHIQQETLGYLITHPLVTGAHFSTASVVLGNVLRFFTGNYRDTVDYLISCYKFGSFTKIPEIVSFKEKLNNSLQYDTIVVERMLLDLLLETKSHQDTERIVTYMEIDPEKDRTIWDALTDNRDVSVFRTWNVNEKEQLEALKTKSFEEELNWLKLRNMIVRTIASAFYLLKPSSEPHNDITNGEKRGMPEVLEDLMKSIRELVSNIEIPNLTQSYFPLQSPGPSRLLLYLQAGHANTIMSLLEILLYLYRLIEGPDAGQPKEKHELQMTSGVVESFQSLVNRIQQEATIEDPKLLQMGTILEELVNCIETLSLGTLLLGFGQSLLKPVRTAIIKKGKKKKEVSLSIGMDTFQNFSSLLLGMENVGISIQGILEHLDSSLLASRLETLSLQEPELTLEVCEDVISDVIEKVEKSYEQSIKELSELLQIKVKYIQSLKW